MNSWLWNYLEQFKIDGAILCDSLTYLPPGHKYFPWSWLFFGPVHVQLPMQISSFFLALQFLNERKLNVAKLFLLRFHQPPCWCSNQDQPFLESLGTKIVVNCSDFPIIFPLSICARILPHYTQSPGKLTRINPILGVTWVDTLTIWKKFCIGDSFG